MSSPYTVNAVSPYPKSFSPGFHCLYFFVVINLALQDNQLHFLSLIKCKCLKTQTAKHSDKLLNIYSIQSIAPQVYKHDHYTALALVILLLIVPRFPLDSFSLTFHDALFFPSNFSCFYLMVYFVSSFSSFLNMKMANVCF